MKRTGAGHAPTGFDPQISGQPGAAQLAAPRAFRQLGSMNDPSKSDPSSHAGQAAKREPALNIPFVVLALMLLMAAIHGARNLLSPAGNWELMANWGFVPGRFSLWLGQAQLSDVLSSAFGPAASRLAIGDLPAPVQLLISDGANAVVSLTSYGLLHGSLGHLATNVLWLAAFGSPVARRLGDMRFLLLIFMTSVAGALAQWLWDPLELSPLIGASAAVSGATAAAARFVFDQRIGFGDLGRNDAVKAIPAATLGGLFSNPRALTFIGFWFATNLLFGTGIVPLAGENASIAWQAHIGGFLAGLLLFPWLDRPQRRKF
ncbi:MAG: rhomboid family intramembrane serine protease [Bosea sp. (in: a-proteobacteria)]